MNKSLIKISGLFAIILSAINIIVFIAVNFAISYVYLADGIGAYIVLLIIAIISIIYMLVGLMFLHYSKLPDNMIKQKKKVILIWAFLLFILNPFSSIFAFLAYFSMLEIKIYNKNIKIDYIEEIKELQKLKDEGYITDKEFQTKKKKILDI
jgi:hypothetical protein